MKITISVDNNSSIKILPVVTVDSVTIDYGQSTNENKESTKYGNIKVLGAEPLASVSIDSFFPTKECSYLENGASIDGQGYVKWFRNNRKKRRPFRVVITDSDKETFNRLMALETFTINKIDQNGNIEYAMQFEQYRKVR